MAAATTGGTKTAEHEGLVHRLYTGTGAFDLIGKRKRFYIFFAALVLIALAGIAIRGFNFSIEFAGGTQIQLPATGTHGTISADQVIKVYADSLHQQPASVQVVGSGKQASIQIRAESLSNSQVSSVEQALYTQFQPVNSSGQPSRAAISDSAVSASWGGQISQQAGIGLIIFLVLVSVFLAIYFEWPMAVAAIIALFNDIIVTAGVYALSGFQVSPATVIGLLTILGFSLYDAVVVFDKVKENTRGLLQLTRRTFPEEANLALNQTLMRSINTSLIGLLPVTGLLVVGVGILGVGELTDLALVQMVGMLIGALSSICLATPLMVDLKMRQQPFQQQARRVQRRREQLAERRAAAAAAGQQVVEDDVEGSRSDEEIDAEVRKERAYAAASSVPSRTPKQRPANRSGRPSGKRRR